MDCKCKTVPASTIQGIKYRYIASHACTHIPGTILSLDWYNNAFTHAAQEYKNALDKLMNVLFNMQIIEEQDEKLPVDHHQQGKQYNAVQRST